MAIYSDEYLPKTDELTMNIRNFDRDRYVMFDEEKAFGTGNQRRAIFRIFKFVYGNYQKGAVA